MLSNWYIYVLSDVLILVIGYGKDWDVGVLDIWSCFGLWFWVINGKKDIGIENIGFGLKYWRWCGFCVIISRWID